MTPDLHTQLEVGWDVIEHVHVGVGEVRQRPVHGAEQGGVQDLRAHPGQDEHGEAPVVALVLEVVRVPPHERHAQVRHGHAGGAGRGLAQRPGGRPPATLQLRHVRRHALVGGVQRLGRLQGLRLVAARGQQAGGALPHPDLHVDLLLQVQLLIRVAAAVGAAALRQVGGRGGAAAAVAAADGRAARGRAGRDRRGPPTAALRVARAPEAGVFVLVVAAEGRAALAAVAVLVQLLRPLGDDVEADAVHDGGGGGSREPLPSPPRPSPARHAPEGVR